jgi:hypothetical protein
MTQQHAQINGKSILRLEVGDHCKHLRPVSPPRVRNGVLDNGINATLTRAPGSYCPPSLGSPAHGCAAPSPRGHIFARGVRTLHRGSIVGRRGHQRPSGQRNDASGTARAVEAAGPLHTAACPLTVRNRFHSLVYPCGETGYLGGAPIWASSISATCRGSACREAKETERWAPTAHFSGLPATQAIRQHCGYPRTVGRKGLILHGYVTVVQKLGAELA